MARNPIQNNNLQKQSKTKHFRAKETTQIKVYTETEHPK